MLQRNLFEPDPVPVMPVSETSGLADYQAARYNQAKALLREFRSVLVTMHPGSGKTRLASAIAKNWKGRVLWVAHRDFLCKQARVELARSTGEYIDLEMANWHSGDSRIVVASVQTLHKKRLERFAKNAFSLVIFDEGHHGTSGTWRAVRDWFSDAKLVYLTATPKRADKIGLNNVIDASCDPFGVQEGLEWGSFVPIIPRSEFVDEIHLDKVKINNGDFALNELEEQIAGVAGQIAKLAVKHVGDRPTIIYTPGVSSAHAVAHTLRELGKTAASVEANTDDDTRKKVLGDFESGQTQFIVNCMLLTEGLDVPCAMAVVMARPTKSESLYIQSSTRPGRPEGWIRGLPTPEERRAAIAASKKPNYILLDVTGHAGRHSLCSAGDLLAGKRLDAAVTRAKERIAASQDNSKSLGEILDEEEAKIKEADEIDRKKVAKAAASAQIRSREGTFDPMKSNDNHARGLEMENPAQPATASQVEWLKKNGLPWKDMTKSTADKLYKQAREWATAGMATWRQRRKLSALGLDPEVSYECASRCMQALNHVGWQPDKTLVNTLRNYINRDTEQRNAAGRNGVRVGTGNQTPGNASGLQERT